MAAKRKDKRTKKQATRPEKSAQRNRQPFFEQWHWVPWFLVTLAVFANVPGMMSGNFLPKTFWFAFSMGLAYLILPAKRPARMALTALGIVWLAYMAWACIAISWSPSVRPGVERIINLFLLPSLAYLLARRTRFWESERFWLCYAGLVGGVALIGLLQVVFPNAPVLSDMTGTGVPRTTMGQRNYAAMYFLLNTPLLVWCFGRSHGRRVMFYGICVLMIIVFVLFVRNRGAWLGLLFAMLFGLGAARGQVREFAMRFRRFWWVAVCAVLLVLGGAVLVSRSTVVQSLGNKANVLWTVTHMFDDVRRIDMWTSSWGAANPWVGAGPGNFPVAATMADTHDKKVKTLNWEVHNDYLQALYDYGAPGLFLFCAFCATLLWCIWRGRRDGLVIAAGAALTGYMVMQGTTFISEKVSSVISIAGLVAIVVGRSEPRLLVSRPIGPKLPSVAWRITGIALLGFAYVVTQSIAGDRALRATQTRIGQLGNLDPISQRQEVARLARDMTNLAQNTMPTMHFDANMLHVNAHQFIPLTKQLKNFSEQMEDDRSAAAFARTVELFARKALDLHPADRVALTTLADRRLKENDAEGALRYMEHAREIWGPDPYDPLIRALVQVYTVQGETDKAAALQAALSENRVGTPVRPTPDDRATDVPTGTTFSWQACNAAQSYSVALWSEGQQKPGEPQYEELEEPTLDLPDDLEPGRVYFWQVTAVSQYTSISGPVWFFRVGR